MTPSRILTVLAVFGLCATLAACQFTNPFQQKQQPAEAPDEMPAPDAVPSGNVTAETLDALPGTVVEPSTDATANRPGRRVLATTKPERGRPIRPGDLVPLTGSEIGRLMIGNYYRHIGGRILYLRPNGQAVVAREGIDPAVQSWQITGDDQLCMTSGAIRTCQHVYRVGDDLLLAAEDGNQRRYRRMPERPSWL
ncbi:MAG: hypothetical protein AAFW76_02815 [Pseudomonadota bacterium]